MPFPNVGIMLIKIILDGKPFKINVRKLNIVNETIKLCFFLENKTFLNLGFLSSTRSLIVDVFGREIDL